MPQHAPCTLSFHTCREHNHNQDLTNKPIQVNENVIILQNGVIKCKHLGFEDSL